MRSGDVRYSKVSGISRSVIARVDCSYGAWEECVCMEEGERERKKGDCLARGEDASRSVRQEKYDRITQKLEGPCLSASLY